MKPLAVLALILALPLAAEVVEHDVTYDQGGTTLEGFHAYDDSTEDPRPGVLVVHQWTGLSDYEKERARMLAAMGYNVFAVDVYGQGVRPKDPAAASAESSKYKADRELFRARLLAGLEVLQNDPRTDPEKLAAIGYCFGGTAVLELARAGADLDGVVSFHGGLAAGENMAAPEGGVKARVLACHGAVDPYVPQDEVLAFWNEMTAAGADWQLVTYPDAVHSFTQESVGDDASTGVAYNAEADARSWADMRQFFGEIFE